MMMRERFRPVDLRLGDCLEIMLSLPDKSVDLVLCDLPYGTTRCPWDVVIPLVPLWEQYCRVAKENAAIVLMAAQPFTSLLITSNLGMFKYSWVWNKVNKFTGALNVKRMPMRDHEDVCVFYRSQPTYNPQLRAGAYTTRHGGSRNTPTVGKSTPVPNYGTRVDGLAPKRILDIPSHSTAKSLHPTQKPEALMAYFVKTYTNAGDLVLDSCMGSGTTGVACRHLGRRFIGIERDPNYFAVARARVLSLGTK